MSRTDTVIGLPSSRPTTPTTEILIPGLKPEPTGVATYTVRRPWWVRNAPSAHAGLAIGSGLATCVMAAYVIVEALTGGIQ